MQQDIKYLRESDMTNTYNFILIPLFQYNDKSFGTLYQPDSAVYPSVVHFSQMICNFSCSIGLSDHHFES